MKPQLTQVLTLCRASWGLYSEKFPTCNFSLSRLHTADSTCWILLLILTLVLTFSHFSVKWTPALLKHLPEAPWILTSGGFRVLNRRQRFVFWEELNYNLAAAEPQRQAGFQNLQQSIKATANVLRSPLQLTSWSCRFLFSLLHVPCLRGAIEHFWHVELKIHSLLWPAAGEATDLMFMHLQESATE